jgi:septum formation inhibitor-activating ATPase MinD
MKKTKERQIPEELKNEILKMVAEDIDTITVTNNGRPCTFDELEGKVLNLGKSYKQRMLEKLAKFEAEEYGKKKRVRTVKES